MRLVLLTLLAACGHDDDGLAQCLAARADFEIPAAHGTAPIVRFDGEALVVAWQDAEDTIGTFAGVGRYGCDGAPLAGPVQLTSASSQLRPVDVLPVDDGALVLLQEGSAVQTQALDASLTAGERVPLTPDAAGADAWGLDTHDGEVVAAVGVSDGVNPELQFLAVRDRTILAHYPEPALARGAVAASAGTLHGAWTVWDGERYHVWSAAVGGTPAEVSDRGAGALLLAAAGDRVVLGYDDADGAIVLHPPTGPELVLPGGPDHGARGAAIGPDGRGLVVTRTEALWFDLDAATVTEASLASVGPSAPRRLDDRTYVVADASDSPVQVRFLDRP